MDWRTLLEESRIRLRSAGVPDADDKLRWWLSEHAGTSLTAVPLWDCPSPADLEAFARASDRLAAGEPVQYICGRAPFRDLDLTVNPAVLIPRPETEQLVTLVLRMECPGEARVLDVGTGSGCIALSLKQERPSWRVTAVDVSEEALAVAAGNASRLGLQVDFRSASLLDGQSPDSLDLIVANLPYIGERERTDLPREVVRYEPGLALFSGEDGTDLILELMRQGKTPLVPGGRIVLETGETHQQILRDAAIQLGYSFRSEPDAAGRDRFVILTA